MKCPGCGENNEEGYVFCQSCGHALPLPEGVAKTQELPAEPRAQRSGPANSAPTAMAQTSVAQSALDEMTPTVAATPAADNPAAPAWRLTAISGLLSGRTFNVGPKGLMIGRDPANCQIVVADDEVSRLHAWIGLDDREQLVVRDRHSANGTYVGPVRVQEKVLRPLDEITLGKDRRHAFRVEKATNTLPIQAQPAAGAKPIGITSALSPVELAALQQEEKTAAGGTVVLKLSGLMARPHLELIVDKFAVKTLVIPDAGLSVGRDSARCQIIMEHPSVSAVHAEFSLKEGHGVLTDRSTNGTFVNGKREKTVELRDGDYVTFGRYASKSLIFRSGLEPELKVETVDLSKDRIAIGRDPSSDVVVDHPIVSKHHAEIVKQDGKVFIVDLGSTNGTFVNGIKVKRHQLQQLDRIVIGPSELHFTGDSLSHAPDTRVVRLDVENVNFQVTDRTTGKPKLLLDDLSLVVKPRELIGLLGPSGAGKTTLMNALNGFAKPSQGQVLYNGVNLYQDLQRLKSTIGFVPQEDIMHRQLSVRRCLYYAAKLRLPEDLSEEEIQRRVEDMLNTLKIDPQRWDNPVATLSGGQRKRVSLGIELLPKPGVLFLDEPTAGLDPRTETLMMMLFRQLANQGSTIVITTHLLGSFGVLDKVVVLVQGRLAYYGPCTKFLEYFKAEAPPDVYDDLTDNNTISYALELKKRFAESPLYKDLIVEPLKAAAEKKSPAQASATEQKAGGGSVLHQLKVLTRRNWELKFGDRGQTVLLFAQAPIIALLVALMASGPNQVQTIFMAMFSALWFGCSNAVREIVDEQSIYRRERQTGLKIPSYVYSKLAILSLIALAQCVSVVAVLLLVKQALHLTIPEAAGAVGIMFLVAVNGSLLGLAISALVRTPEKALALFPLALIPELLLSGLFLPVNKIETIIPITVEQLIGGKLFAQPEAKRHAYRAMNTSLPAAPQSSGPAGPSSSTGPSSDTANALKGQFGHQVLGAVTPSPETQKVFHKYTPAPQAGMPGSARWLSALAVSRWGLEALSDLCLHGAHSIEDSSYKIINTVSISLHPDDQEKLEQGLELPAEAFMAGVFPLPSNFWVDKGPYLAVLALYAVAMMGLILFLMKRKDAA